MCLVNTSGTLFEKQTENKNKSVFWPKLLQVILVLIHIYPWRDF
jgi:hypothetical protein